MYLNSTSSQMADLNDAGLGVYRSPFSTFVWFSTNHSALQLLMLSIVTVTGCVYIYNKVPIISHIAVLYNDMTDSKDLLQSGAFYCHVMCDPIGYVASVIFVPQCIVILFCLSYLWGMVSGIQ